MLKIIIPLIFLLIALGYQYFIKNELFEQYFGRDFKIDIFSETPTITDLNKKDFTRGSCHIPGSTVEVSNVIDGDTFKFTCKNKTYKVRIIGIDTPETKHPTKGVQCFGKEASQYTKDLLEGKQVILNTGKGSDDTDKYGRLLRYVNIDGEDFGKKIIGEGYAFSYKYFPHEKLSQYNSLEKTARKNETGLWNPNTCNY